MTRETRRLLFCVFVLFFFVAGAAALAYSQGWRLDFKTGRIEKTGGIYIRSEPADAEITLDGKLVENKAGLLRSGTLISNLTPGSYRLRLVKDNYHPWEKGVEVTSGGAALFEKIVLLPRGGSQKAAPPGDGFLTIKGKVVEVIGGKVAFDSRKLPGSRLVSSSPGSRLITASADNTYYLTDIASLEASLNLNALFENLRESELGVAADVRLSSLAFHPFDDARIVIEAADGLYIIDTRRLTLERISQKTAWSFAVRGDGLVWADSSGVWSYNLIFRVATRIGNYTPAPNDRPVELQIAPSGSFIAVLTKSGMLNLLGPTLNAPLRVADKVRVFAFSPDSRYLAFADYDGPVAAYRIDRPVYLELDAAKGVQVEALSWYKDSAHILTLREGDLSFTEVAPGTPVNSSAISARVSQFSYDEDSDLVYYLTPDGLFSFKISRS